MPHQVFFNSKTISRITKLPIPETQPLSLCWGLKGKDVFISFFKMLAKEWETLKLLKWLSKAIY